MLKNRELRLPVFTYPKAKYIFKSLLCNSTARTSLGHLICRVVPEKACRGSFAVSPVLLHGAFPECHGLFKPAFAEETFAGAHAVFHAGVLRKFVGDALTFQGGAEQAAVVRVHAAVAAAHPQKRGGVGDRDLLFHAGQILKFLRGCFPQKVVPAAGVGLFAHGHHRIAQDDGTGLRQAEFGVAHGFGAETGGRGIFAV